MQYIAFDAHKHYTLASVARPDGQVVREQRIEHERSNTIRTARSRTSGENRLGLAMTPSPQGMEPPGNPARFISWFLLGEPLH
jgi:hypothetical protein